MKGSRNLAVVVLLCIVNLMLFTSHAFSEEEYEFDRMWPVLEQPWYLYPNDVAVDESGNVYVAEVVTNRVQKFTSEGEFITKWGTWLDNGSFLQPGGIAVNKKGEIFVTSRYGNQVLKYSSDGEKLTEWGREGSFNGEFQRINGIDIDDSGNLYVVDVGNNRIQKFDSEGNFLLKWGIFGSGEGEFDEPCGIAIDENQKVYVADYNNRRVQIFSSEGTFLSKWDDNEERRFAGFRGICTDRQGYVYTADGSGVSIQKFDTNGNHILNWGGYGSEDGQFGWHFKISADTDGHIYEADWNFSYIQKFTSEGEFVAKWDSKGKGDGEFRAPKGIAVDSSENIYVVDSDNNRIQKFDSDGNFITKWGSAGAEDGRFKEPYGIAIDSSDNIYVTDAGNNRIQKFRSDGTFVTKWGDYGSANGRFDKPYGIATDKNEYVYVVDRNNDRVQKFDLNGTFIKTWGNPDFDFSDLVGIAVIGIEEVYVTDYACVWKFNSNGELIKKISDLGARGIATDHNNNIYLSIAWQNMIQKRTRDLNVITQVGKLGSDPGMLVNPTAFCISKTGNLYVSDTGNNRIQVFKSNLSVEEPSHTGGTPIPDTGQTKCYNETEEIPCPNPGEDFYGQDANYTINPPSYTKLDDQGNDLSDEATEWTMVRDNVTGLIWEMKTEGGPIHSMHLKYTWQKAQDDLIAELNRNNFGGYSDWRLPDAEELRSIADYEQYNPAINTAYFPNTNLGHYWSSTEDSAGDLWYVDFIVGENHNGSKEQDKYVRAVRGERNPSSDHLTVNSDDKTVTDTKTGLMWERGLNVENKLIWKEALRYCESLSLAGHDDWRTPTIKELASVTDMTEYGPAIDSDLFPGTATEPYWASTTNVENPGNGWGVNFVAGNDWHVYKKSDEYYIRCVRPSSSDTPPSVVSTHPSENAVSIATDTVISVEFSKDMDPTSINGSTFKVNNGSSDINGVVKYDNETRTVTFTPSESFDYETEYTVTLGSQIKDAGENALQSDYAWSFTTGSEPPSIISTSPSDNAAGIATDDTVISVEFSKDMEETSITSDTIDTFKVKDSSGDIDGTVNYDKESKTATFTPAKGYFNYGTEYTVTITSGVRDTDGNALESDYTWSFTTEFLPDHPGYAIIIQGKRSDGEGLEDHNRTTQFVYRILRGRGLEPENIRYFNYNTGQEGVYSIPRKDEISATITEWAKEQMNEGPADLYIIMVNHGSEGRFFIHDSDPITPSDMAGWLDALQDGLQENVRDQNKIIAILGFCYSGLFIPELSGTNRVIITSSAADELSHRGSQDENGILEGEYFVAEFFRGVASGKSVKECFEMAVASTETYTADLDIVSGRPYLDQARQHPLLDDNGDGKGSNDLSSWRKDGLLSKNIRSVGMGQAYNPPGDVAFIRVAESIFLEDSETHAKGLWAKVEQPERVKDIWIEVKSPVSDIKMKNTDDAQIPNQPVMRIQKIPLNVDETKDLYEWDDAYTEGVPGFENPGIYQVFYFVKDKETGNVSRLMETRVYKNKKDNTPPEPVSSLSSRDEEKGLGLVTLDWENSTDTEGDHLTYTVLIADDTASLDSDPIVRKEGLLLSTCQIDTDDEIMVGQNYQWKVLAIDKYGMFEETDDIGEFRIMKTNPDEGWIQVYVYDSCTEQFLDGAEVSVGESILEKTDWGYYEGKKTDGEYNVMVKAEGYHSSDEIEIEVSKGRIVSVKDLFFLDSERVANPVFSPPAGIYTEKKNVKIEVPCHPDGATVYYTTDGSEPDETAMPYETGSLILTSDCMTIRAKAYKADHEPSETAMAGYEVSDKGNINGDDRVDLADAILALRVVCGMVPGETLNLTIANEINDDARIGLAEAISVLKKLPMLQEGCQE